MNEFDIKYDLISLDGIYTDISDPDAKGTTLYANGKMQAEIYIVYSYSDYDVSDDDPEVTGALDQYIKSKIEFYWLDSSNNLHELPDDWGESEKDNGYPHNIDYVEPGSIADGSGISGRRVPYYLIPPAGDYGKKTRLCAKLIDSGHSVEEQTSVESPVTITTKKFELNDSDLTIDKVVEGSGNELRSLCYNHNGSSNVPQSHKLIKLQEYKGMKAKDKVNGVKVNTWMAMVHTSPGHKVGCFPEANVGKIAVLNNKTPCEYENKTSDYAAYDELYGSGYDGQGWRWGATTDDFDTSQVVDGIPMVAINSVNLDARVGSGSHKEVNFEMQNFVAIDNYGNTIYFDMNWNADGGWYGQWAPVNVQVKPPESSAKSP